ncbi:glutamate/gamma-aminobutyrate family transporter YjeM [Ligilactobacillus aviarius]|uniref:glutamate/gamma-aminobutyrate family transporter YjeM n=1 Tax=Ligilactobacillus aviarius TaxID=1606 RepID=UPI0025A48BD5|nr:glutamate/gamma-aminobutyrate family transporter YjeM [Ligilactobacillus aviarius]MDM8277663.1 glutamate/gamma-aminobutyrate family transporter YjeM [Ligilactobacillus aviarius]
MNSQSKKITYGSLVLMIFSAIFGFSNSMTAFYQMGYSSIIWYIVAAVAFFLPSALMFAEYGATFKEAKGGIYSWLKGSTNEKFAFIGTFIWLAAWVVWLVSSTQFFIVAVSTALFGSDKTQTWGFGPFNSNQVVGILGVLFILLVTFLASRGIDKIAKVATFGGIFAFGITILFSLFSIIVLIAHHGVLAQGITGIKSFTTSPNHNFQSPIAIISFLVYAIFAYGGLETTSGVIGSVDKPEKTYPKALITVMILMTLFYLILIVMCGISTNWHSVMGKSSVDLANCEYVLINNLGIEVGKAFGLGTAALGIGKLFSHITALSDVLTGLGAAFVMIYSPVKSFVLGSDSRLLPKKITKLNDKGMPANAMWLQALVVSLIMLFVAFGGKAATQFYTILTDMMNVSSSAPYLFLIAAFPFFKQKQNLDRPFVFYKNKKVVWTVTSIVWLVVAAGIVFTCVEPILSHDYMTAFWTAFGPIFFGVVGWILYKRSEAKLD